MQLLLTRKKWLFVGVISLAVGIIVILQSAISSTSHRAENVHHLRLLAKSNAQRKDDIGKNFDKEPEQQDNRDLFFNDIGFDLESQDNDNHSSTHSPVNLKTASPLVDKLADALHHKLSALTTQERKLRQVCHNPDVVANSCDNGNCLRTSFPTGLKERVAELVEPTHLKVSDENQAALDSMVEDVPRNVEFALVTAASSNHFLEVQGLIKSLHQSVYPHFKNFTFVFVNIGLTSKERAQVAEHCKCHVLDFPFEKFPTHVQKTKCYSWKPLILNALINSAQTIVWIDSSIRFDSDPSYLRYLFQRVDKRTIQLGSTQVIAPFRTFRSMYHYFGDEPCMYIDMFQALAGVVAFKSEYFVKRAVLDPWAACALSQSCMCPSKQPKKSCVESKKMEEAWEAKQGPIVYGLCHRFDQSSISIILHKLYQGYFHWVNFHIGGYLRIQRNDNQEYFHSLEKIL